MSSDLSWAREELSGRAGSSWEIYAKKSVSRESRRTAALMSEADRREEGFSARWQEGGCCRFASASTAGQLVDAIRHCARIAPVSPSPWPDLPAGSFRPSAREPAQPLPDSFEALSRELAAESRGKARLVSLTVTAGTIEDCLENGAGFSGERSWRFGYGTAQAAGIAEERRVAADVVFAVGGGAPLELPRIARAISDRCTLPLEGRQLLFSRGDLLTDPCVTAAMLAAILPLFCGDARATLLSRRYLDRDGRFTGAGIDIVDDARADFAFDGEGTPVRRTVIVGNGISLARLHDRLSAARSGEKPTGNSARPSYRRPPSPGSSRIQLRSAHAVSPRELLDRVARGLYASAVTAPVRVDLEEDRYTLEVEGWSIQRGRSATPVAHARITGRLSEWWKRVTAAGDDVRWFPLPAMTGAPTLYLDRISFT